MNKKQLEIMCEKYKISDDDKKILQKMVKRKMYLSLIEDITSSLVTLDDESLNLVYKIAHVGVGKCKHEDWEKEIQDYLLLRVL